MRYKPKPKTKLKSTLHYPVLKPTKLPDGFILLQDTREQQPLFARIPPGLIIKSTALQHGDYSIAGFDHTFAIERKGISDLMAYIGRDRKKTVQKMGRLARMEWAGLVIEASESELLSIQEFTALTPETIRAALISFEVRYGVHIYYAESTVSAARWVLDRCVKYWNIKHEIK